MASARRLMTRRGVAFGVALLGVAVFALLSSVVPTSAAEPVQTPTITGGPTGLIRTRTASFTYTNSASVNFLCALDSAPFAGCPTTPAKSGSITFGQITDGQHMFSVKARVGSQTSSAASRSFSVDATAPRVLSIKRIDPNPRPFGILRWTVTFSEPVTNVGLANFSLKSTSLGSTPSFVSITQAGPTTYTASANTGSSATAGNTPTVRLDLSGEDGITDAAGNSLANELNGETYDIDGSAPLVTLTKANGVTVAFPFSTNQTVTTIGGSCGTSPGDVATVSIAGGQTGSAACVGGNWTFTLTFSLFAGGNYTFTATQADTAGNGGTSGPKTIIIDKTPPLVTVTKLNGSTVSFPYLTNANVTSIGGSCGTVSGDLPTVAVSINGASSVNTACFLGAWTLPVVITAVGTYTVVATQQDSVNNSTSTAARSFTIDRTAPLVTLTKVNGVTVPTLSYTTSANITSLSGTCGTATGDNTTISVVVNGGSALTAPCLAGVWTLPLSLTVNGAYNVIVRQSDSAGNTGSYGPVVITRIAPDITPPIVTVTKVNASTSVEGDPAFIGATTTTKTQVQTIGGACGNASGDNPTVSVTIVGPSPSASTPARASQTWTGTATCPATGVGAGTWTFTLSPTINADGTWDGDYVITVTQGDNAGNTGTTGPKTLTMASQNFTISGNAVQLLTPGGVSDLRLTIRNPHKFSIRLDALSIGISGTNASCAALTNFIVVSAYPRAGLVTVPPGDTILDVNKVPQIQMKNLNVSQDLCKNATITLTYSGMASRA